MKIIFVYFIFFILLLSCGALGPEQDTTGCLLAVINEYYSSKPMGSDADLLNTLLVSAACSPE